MTIEVVIILLTDILEGFAIYHLTEENLLKDTIESGQSAIVFGPRGVGKSHILNRALVFQKKSKKYKNIQLVDCENPSLGMRHDQKHYDEFLAEFQIRTGGKRLNLLSAHLEMALTAISHRFFNLG